jgi:diacylglycerol kinase (ATP)
MIFAVFFYAFSALFFYCGWSLWLAGGVVARLAALGFFWGALAEGCTGTLYLLNALFRINAGRLFKRADGASAGWPLALIWPYLVFEYGAWHSYRKKGREPLLERVTDGIFQGGRPRPGDLAELRAAGIGAVLDVVAEMADPIELRQADDFVYLAVPTLDGTTPTLAELERGADFVAAQRAAGRNVLIHCIFGHGRSSTFTIAALIKAGLVSTPAEGLEMLSRLKRKIWLSRAQLRTLKAFAEKGN